MIVSGKQIAQEIADQLRQRVSGLPRSPLLSIVRVGAGGASDSFIRAKQTIGGHIGVEVGLGDFPADISTVQLSEVISKIAESDKVNGVVVQLPLPSHLDRQEVLSHLPPFKDPDVISPAAQRLFYQGVSKVTPPVVAAVDEILKRCRAPVTQLAKEGKKVAVVGDGFLVGQPVTVWLKKHGINPIVIHRRSDNIAVSLSEVDVIISGAGAPGLIQAGMIKTGVILIDAGTSEAEGKVVGDADPGCAARSSFFTPVPGGVGPVAVVMLFKNMLELMAHE